MKSKQEKQSAREVLLVNIKVGEVFLWRREELAASKLRETA